MKVSEVLIQSKQPKRQKIEWDAKKEFDCPVCRAQGLSGYVVDFQDVMLCGRCGSIFSESHFNKTGKVVKAIKIGERKYQMRLSPLSVEQDCDVVLGVPYFAMLDNPMILECNENE